jgi:hypothetical protein
MYKSINHKIKLTNTKPFSLKSILSISMILLFVLTLSFNNNCVDVYGHTLFSDNNNNNNGSGIQVKTNGRYKVELSTNPSKIPINKSIDILLRLTSISNGSTGTGGAEVTEIPAYLSLVKDDKVDNLQNTLVMIRGGHYNFNSVFSDKGKYLLFVDIKDIYYTNTIFKVIFELNAGIPIVDQFYNTIESFLLNFIIFIFQLLVLYLSLRIGLDKKIKMRNNDFDILAIVK